MKKIKTLALSLLVFGVMFQTISAGTWRFKTKIVPAFNQVGESGSLTLTERSIYGIKASLEKNGKVDKIKFWTIWFNTEAYKSGDAIVAEGTTSNSVKNLKNLTHVPGDCVRVQWRSCNQIISFSDYYMTGYAIYY